jgi:hypothetical protein
MATLVCPKCSKVFKDKYESQCKAKLDLHLKRKNSCDRSPDTPFIREKTLVHHHEVKDLSNLDLNFEKSTLVDMIVKIFQHNECACIPNISKQHVIYILNGTLHSEPLTSFIKTFWYAVMIPQFFKQFKTNVLGMFGVDVSSEHLSDAVFTAYIVGNKEFYSKLLRSLRNYFNTMEKSKRLEIKRKLVI